MLGSSTYVIGFLLLVACTAVGLFPGSALVALFACFLIVNLSFYLAIRTGWNLRWPDPSLTLAQLSAGVVMVFLILLSSPHIQFMVVTFYSAIFVFAMLRLERKQLIRFEAFLLITYLCALAARSAIYRQELDMRVELISTVLIVVSSFWFTVAAAYISNLRTRLGESLRAIEEQASRDGLTGVWNRRHIDLLVATELQRNTRTKQPLCAFLVDVDHFKAINDRFGHLSGDIALREVANALQSSLRPTDHLGRFGGEEFLVLLPGTQLRDALICAERLRVQVSGLVSSSGCGNVTVSVGVASVEPGELAAQWLARADRALYAAKSAGRNRVAEATARMPMTAQDSETVLLRDA